MKDKLAEQLHIWYLEAIKKISPKSYNPNAIKAYSELEEDQKDIDRYIANKILNAIPKKKVYKNPYYLSYGEVKLWNLCIKEFLKNLEVDDENNY